MLSIRSEIRSLIFCNMRSACSWVIVPAATALARAALRVSSIVVSNVSALSAASTQVRVGDHITFFNGEDDNTVNHQIVADDGSFDTGVLRPGEFYSVTFESPGTYSFHDVLDSSVKGTITVK